MKQKWKFLCLLSFCVLLPALMLTGCITGPVHKETSAYAHNETHHWYKCLCGQTDCEFEYDKEVHEFEEFNRTNSTNTTTITYACDCGATKTETYTHAPADMFSSDNTYHWKDCTCGLQDCNKQHLKAEHSGTTQESDSGDTTTITTTCSVCHTTATKTYTHSEASTYSFSDNYHWNDCACGYLYCDRTFNADEHNYKNPVRTDSGNTTTITSTCICGKEKVETYTHAPATVYTKNDTHHWYDCTCSLSGCDKVYNKTTHNYENPVRTDSGNTTTITSTCDCGKEKVETYTHAVASTYEYDETKHWHTCGCGLAGCDKVYNEDEHNFEETSSSTNGDTITTNYACECGKTKTEETLNIAYVYAIFKPMYEAFSNNQISFIMTGDNGAIQSLNHLTGESFGYQDSENFDITIKTDDGYAVYSLYEGIYKNAYIQSELYTFTMPNTFEEFIESCGADTGKIIKTADYYIIEITTTNEEYGVTATTGLKFTDTAIFSNTYSETYNGETITAEVTITTGEFATEKFEELKAFVLDPTNGFPTPTPAE